MIFMVHEVSGKRTSRQNVGKCKLCQGKRTSRQNVGKCKLCQGKNFATNCREVEWS